MPESKRQPSQIQSVSRAVSILKCFRGDAELGLTEVSRMLELHKSTTAGIINTLKSEGFLEQNEQTGKLHLGIDLFSLAINARSSLGELCEPYLTELLSLTGETVNLAVPSNSEIVYIAKRESPHSIRISTSVGSRLPMYCTANGKAILSTYGREKAASLLDGVEFVKFTDKTITSRATLFRELDLVTTDGVAYDNEEYETGIVCVAAPLYSRPGGPVGALSVSGPTMRMDEKTRGDIAEILRGITRQICDKLSRLA
jgi:DNA-binding IclR family transcriptional regulator